MYIHIYNLLNIIFTDHFHLYQRNCLLFLIIIKLLYSIYVNVYVYCLKNIFAIIATC